MHLIKYIVASAFFVVAFTPSLSQYRIKVERVGLTIESVEKFKPYDTDDKRVYGYESKSYIVNVEVFKYKKKRVYLKDKLNKLTALLQLQNVIESGPVPYLDLASIYSVGIDKSTKENIPVYNVVIHNAERKQLYEVTIYCYNGDFDAGLAMVKSMMFI